MNRPAPNKNDNLKSLLKPRGIVFIGGQHLARSIDMCRSAGFCGDIQVVNPKYESIGGIACIPSINELPATPEAAFIALSPERSIEAVRQLALVGVKGAIVHASGFGERGDEFREMESRLIEAAGVMAVLGPNTNGLLNNFDGIAMWGDNNHCERVHGPGVAVISQSGAFLFGITNVEQAYPMGYAIGIGNQLIISCADAIHAVLDDPRVGSIGLYLEGLTDGIGLSQALARALQQNVPVVLLRGGGTPESAEASMSHTGNLAIPNDYWNALVERYGLLEVRSPKQLVETTKLIAVSGVPRGPRCFIATYSGAACTLLTEQGPEYGLQFPVVSEENRARVRDTLPENVNITNPFDLNLPWESKNKVSLDNAASIARCLLDASDHTVDLIAFLFDIPRSGNGKEEPWLPTIQAMIDVRQQSELPCIVASIMPGGIGAEQRHRLLQSGVSPLSGLAEFLDALGAATQYQQRREVIMSAGSVPDDLIAMQPAASTVMHNEYDSKQALANYGLQFPQRWAGPVEHAVDAAEDIGFPVVVKLLSDTVGHKAKIGGVQLNLADSDQVQIAIETMRHSLAENDIELREVLVETMIENPVAELIIGIKRHEQLGLALLIGKGGVEVEIASNYLLILLPATSREYVTAIMRVCPELPGRSVDKMAELISRVAAYAIDHAESLVELDINPVIVDADNGVTAVDALLVTVPS
jgi:acetate---CoA ligase (ADP-forming)